MSISELKNMQRETWNGLAQPWFRWNDLFEGGAISVTERLIGLSEICRSDTVLDVACGLGDTSYLVSNTLSADGSVVGIDIADTMIDICKVRFQDRPNIEFISGDAEKYLKSDCYDAILSRFGLMFFPDTAAILSELYKALKPGKKLCFSVWATPEHVPLISLTFSEVAKALALPAPPASNPGPFKLSNKSELVAELERAGFKDVLIQKISVPFELESAEEYLSYSKDILPKKISSCIDSDLSPSEKEALWKRILARSNEYVQEGIVKMDCKAYCISATKI